ncbi:MAG: hypothetical protein K0R68_1991 [Mycobacterium sp.]|jgi:hypothetical protein|nr:hypothetical protein [Mycobacterium sp.]
MTSSSTATKQPRRTLTRTSLAAIAILVVSAFTISATPAQADTTDVHVAGETTRAIHVAANRDDTLSKSPSPTPAGSTNSYKVPTSRFVGGDVPTSESKRWVGFNSHGMWINLSYTAQKVIIAMTSAAVTSGICRIPEVGWALCALSAVAFTGLFELLKSHRICPPDKPIFKWYVSNHPSYCE